MNHREDQEKVPLFGTWRAGYTVVLVVLAVLIGIFYWVTKHFS